MNSPNLPKVILGNPPGIYRGSVKDVIAPVPVQLSDQSIGSAAVFRYTDFFSVFDWGRMPDALPKKGAALAILAADLFEKLESPSSWREFSRSSEALELRRGVGQLTSEPELPSRSSPTLSLGSALNESGERLQNVGLRTHYLGLYDAERALAEKITEPALAPLAVTSLAQAKLPVHERKHLLVKKVEVVKPLFRKVLGRHIADYSALRTAPVPKLIPLEVVFRFSCPPGSSYITRAGVAPGTKFEFPVLECFSKLEPSDRFLTLTEALAMSGLNADQLQELLLKSAWVAAYLKHRASLAGLELADGKLEWAWDEKGDLILVDAIGPDELRLLSGGAQLSKEFLRQFYRGTPWYEQVQKAKEASELRGTVDWKRLVQLPVPHLGEREKEIAVHLYPSLTNALTGKKWFSDAWELSRVIEGIQSFARGDRA